VTLIRSSSDMARGSVFFLYREKDGQGVSQTL
jgi:hypothetical protein